MSRLVMRARVNSWLIMHSVRGVPAVYYLCMSAWLPASICKRVNSWLLQPAWRERPWLLTPYDGSSPVMPALSPSTWLFDAFSGSSRLQ